MIKLVQNATVKGGRIRLCTPAQYNTLLNGFEGEEVKLTIQKRNKGSMPRSIRQNNYLWGMVYALISEHTGHSTDEIHALMGDMFLKELVMVCEKTVTIIKSTSKLNTAEFSDYIEAIRSWAESNLSSETSRFRIPLPDESEFPID